MKLKSGSEKPKNGQRCKNNGRVDKLNNVFLRLIVSACLFLLVFLGGRLIPEQVYDVFGAVQGIISGDSILPDTVQSLGKSLTEGDSLGSVLRDWCAETFLPSSEPVPPEVSLDDRLKQAEQFSAQLLPKLSVSLD